MNTIGLRNGPETPDEVHRAVNSSSHRDKTSDEDKGQTTTIMCEKNESETPDGVHRAVTSSTPPRDRADCLSHKVQAKVEDVVDHEPKVTTSTTPTVNQRMEIIHTTKQWPYKSTITFHYSPTNIPINLHASPTQNRIDRPRNTNLKHKILDASEAERKYQPVDENQNLSSDSHQTIKDTNSNRNNSGAGDKPVGINGIRNDSDRRTSWCNIGTMIQGVNHQGGNLKDIFKRMYKLRKRNHSAVDPTVGLSKMYDTEKTNYRPKSIQRDFLGNRLVYTEPTDIHETTAKSNYTPEYGELLYDTLDRKFPQQFPYNYTIVKDDVNGAENLSSDETLVTSQRNESKHNESTDEESVTMIRNCEGNKNDEGSNGRKTFAGTCNYSTSKCKDNLNDHIRYKRTKPRRKVKRGNSIVYIWNKFKNWTQNKSKDEVIVATDSNASCDDRNHVHRMGQVNPKYLTTSGYDSDSTITSDFVQLPQLTHEETKWKSFANSTMTKPDKFYPDVLNSLVSRSSISAGRCYDSDDTGRDLIELSSIKIGDKHQVSSVRRAHTFNGADSDRPVNFGGQGQRNGTSKLKLASIDENELQNKPTTRKRHGKREKRRVICKRYTLTNDNRPIIDPRNTRLPSSSILDTLVNNTDNTLMKNRLVNNTMSSMPSASFHEEQSSHQPDNFLTGHVRKRSTSERQCSPLTPTETMSVTEAATLPRQSSCTKNNTKTHTLPQSRRMKKSGTFNQGAKPKSISDRYNLDKYSRSVSRKPSFLSKISGVIDHTFPLKKSSTFGRSFSSNASTPTGYCSSLSNKSTTIERSFSSNTSSPLEHIRRSTPDHIDFVNSLDRRAFSKDKPRLCRQSAVTFSTADFVSSSHAKCSGNRSGNSASHETEYPKNPNHERIMRVVHRDTVTFV